MKNSALHKVRKALEENRKAKTINSFIPSIWLNNNKSDQVETSLNLRDLLVQTIDEILTSAKDFVDYSSPLSSYIPSQNWVKEAVVYSMMIRTQTAWDHNHDGNLDSNIVTETGTFIKSLLMLFHLKKLGVNTLYLLPINQTSTMDKKGDFGSPYAVSSFFKLDQTLKDNLTENKTTIEEEFAALCEACHILNIRVTIDFVPRTNAVDSDFILTNPEWFYWIDVSESKNYAPPSVPELFDPENPISSPTVDRLGAIYRSSEVISHINKFRVNPKEINPVKWAEFQVEYVQNPKMNMLKEIEKRFNITVAKAFSDGVNDNQPPWSDITFFRMYLDHPTTSLKFLPNKDLAPYILFDVIKANMHKGNKPNTELWKTLSNIAPYFQKTFGIDGARIDMGHALPSELVSQIITTAQNFDSEFVFIAEELEAKNAQAAFEAGYDMIIGNTFKTQPRMFSVSKYDEYNKNVGLPIPLFACSETHDTPRISGRFKPYSDANLMSRLAHVMNMFAPNSVPFINSGQEIFERQPMNTGLDSTQGDEFIYLPTSDPYYGKLALFDRYCLHWDTHGLQNNINLYEACAALRKRFIKTITNKQNYQFSNLDFLPDKFVRMLYTIDETERENYSHLLIVANLSQNIVAYHEYESFEFQQCFASHYPFSNSGSLINNHLEVQLNNYEIQLFLVNNK